MEEHIHAKEVMVEKLGLKCSTYKAVIAKLEAQVQAAGLAKGWP